MIWRSMRNQFLLVILADKLYVSLMKPVVACISQPQRQ